MPYTPPSHQSPASSKPTTPAISRNSSYATGISCLSPPHSHVRPDLPRSLSSATYLNKHRRSPSTTLTQDGPAATYKLNSTSKDAESVLHNKGSQSLNELVIPLGAIISPPDSSSDNSDGDESSGKVSKRREVVDTWNELQEAVRSMTIIKREPSPVRNTSNTTSSRSIATSYTTASEPTTSVTSPSLLSPEARKITHSRCSTETALPAMIEAVVAEAEAEAAVQMTDDEDEDDDDSDRKPSLVRKKSGELVKPALRPSSRRRYSSMPGTPTYSKSVHFDDNGNQTRHFLQVDKPSAVSATSSPAEDYSSETEFPLTKQKIEWEIKLANFPGEEQHWRKWRPVWVEKLYLSSDSTSLVGEVGVGNWAFQKFVTVRFTLDYWKTTSEVSAEFLDDGRREGLPDNYDRFSFSIRLADQANLETKTLLLCVRYNVLGQEHYDNNDGANFQIDFIKKVTNVPVPSPGLGARPISAIPRSKHRGPTSRGRQRAPSVDDDMTKQVDRSRFRYVPSTIELLGEDTQPSLKLKSQFNKRVGIYSHLPNPSGQGLGGRYDFGASLSAALSTAQEKMTKQNNNTFANRPSFNTASSGYFSKAPTAMPMKKPERPEHPSSDRPAIGSAQYKDLVSKFCYFTPTSSGKLSPSLHSKKPLVGNGDGNSEQDGYFQHSGSSGPSPPGPSSPQLDGGSDDRPFFSAQVSPSSTRPQSPIESPRGSKHSATMSPGPHGAFGFRFQNQRDGYLADSPSLTAIHG